ncbi:mycothiol synthase [Arthrobacter roseus]|uniref:mycothiol synthase n=1 Tax=Arthrobacter roseus TaxID=136274 RepID=UPI001963C020|nr:mycothiol synthase [Arthrobacter roseus]MBM7849362.1 mycothiol synthase [Arthrobacter roseus]
MTENSANTWPVVVSTGTPDADLIEDLQELAGAAIESDGNPPFSEQTLVDVKSTDSEVTVYAAYCSADFSSSIVRGLAGAAVVIHARGEDDGGLLELVTRPSFRNQGVGQSVVNRASSDPGFSALSAWSHGNHAAAARLAMSCGFEPVRELWRMRQTRANAAAAGIPAEGRALPEGVAIRTFRPGLDDDAWLRANAAAFVHHPEQGRTSLQDLCARMAEDWFDAEGFLLAIRNSPGATDDGELLGFHWTKVHPAASGQPAIGEVYVVGVTPAAQGMGLGKALTLAGIEHLHGKGLQAVMLYVDADNEAAVALYQKLGFTRWDVDVMYAVR